MKIVYCIPRKRSGFSLVELLVAIVVLGIISAILINTGGTAQRRARITAASTALEDFANAFSTACTDHPGVMKDRENAWGTDGSGYSTKTALSKLVTYMNQNLDPDNRFEWVDSENCYVSYRKDPWGGTYQIHEYPYAAATSDGYDPTSGSGVSAMRISIWATGVNETVRSYLEVDEESVGVGLSYRAGNVYIIYHGISNEYAYTGLKLLDK